MKKIITTTIMVISLMLMTGCGTVYQTVFSGSGTHELGKIGDVQYYSVHADHLMGPNQTAMVRYNTRTKADPVELKINGGAGIGATLVNGVSQVVSSYLFGSSIEPDEHNYSDNSSINVEGSSQNQGQVQGQNQSNNNRNNNRNNNNNNNENNGNGNGNGNGPDGNRSGGGDGTNPGGGGNPNGSNNPNNS